MTAITFDTLRYTKTLEDAGFTRQQAEAQASASRAAMAEVFETQVKDIATKGELSVFKSEMRGDFSMLEAALRSEMREMELRMTIKLGGMIIALGGVLVAIKYLG